MTPPLKDLTAPTMVSVSGDWLTHFRALLEAQAALAGILGPLEAAHEQVLTTHHEAGAAEERVAELTTELGVTDAFHDRKLRGIYQVLTGAADLADDPDRRAAFLSLRDRLMRQGLAAVQRSYRDQAGNAKIARREFDVDARTTADAIVIDAEPLGAHVDMWLDAADQIGEMNAERTQLQASEKDGVTAEDVHQARLAWIKAVNAFLTLLDFTDFDDETRDKLLAELHDAEDKAARAMAEEAKKKAAQKAAQDAPQPEPKASEADAPAADAEPQPSNTDGAAPGAAETPGEADRPAAGAQPQAEEEPEPA